MQKISKRNFIHSKETFIWLHEHKDIVGYYIADDLVNFINILNAERLAVSANNCQLIIKKRNYLSSAQVIEFIHKICQYIHTPFAYNSGRRSIFSDWMFSSASQCFKNHILNLET